MNFARASALFFFMIAHCIEACTAFQLKSQDGAYLYCRTLEFGYTLDSNLLIVPRKTEFMGTAENGPGLKWKTRYGYVGMNQTIGRTLVSDGMNEKGLVVGALYLPGYAQYEAPDPMKSKRTVGGWELASFLLGNCESVSEVKRILPTILVAQIPKPDLGDFILPLHFYICDPSGAVAIVEYSGGKRHIFDNPLGVLTNSPTFDWHLIHLNRAINMSPINSSDLKLSDWTLKPNSQGSGLIGLPGDFTSISRFSRAALFSQWATQQKTDLDAVRLGFHILNTFDIFDGIVRPNPSEKASLPGKRDSEITEWVVIHDRMNLVTYFRTYLSMQIQKIDLKRIDFAKPGFRQIPLNREFKISDATDQGKPLDSSLM